MSIWNIHTRCTYAFVHFYNNYDSKLSDSMTIEAIN
jgi:hypothetical protein